MEKDKFENLAAKLANNEQIIGKHEKYFNSAVLLPVINLDGELHLLFQQRANGIRQANEVCFPGGKYEEEVDQNYWQAAVRETGEELGIEEERIRFLSKLGTIVAPIGVTIDAFVGKIDISSIEELNLNENEVADVFTIPLSYFKASEPEEHRVRVEIQPHYFNQQGQKVTLLPADELDLPPKYSKPWVGKEHDIYVYSTEYGIIWGITAELIVELINKLD
ncbi:MAG: NUDIX hydrolase [Bacillota bacterium]